MNLRPRCREWLPLCTQQLRLRNLIRIQGHNIECEGNNDEALIFYTLHYDKDGDALYTSEALPQRHLEQKWTEIAGDDKLRKSNANCVCVKVWVRWVMADETYHYTYKQTELAINSTKGLERKEEQSALTKKLANICLTPQKLTRPPEKLLFTWAVYFSGLIPLSEQSNDAKYQPNCLIFQLNDEYFTSPGHFTNDGLREQLSMNYRRYAASLPKEPTSDEFGINSPSVSRSSSPVHMDKTCDLLTMSIARYMQLNCPATEVRESYNLEQLLRLQEKQRLKLQKLRESILLSAEIKRLDIRCITTEEINGKSRATTFSNFPAGVNATQQQYHSMGRKLSHLLAEQQEIAPSTLYEAQQLQKQIETLRCKRRLLQTENAVYAKRISNRRQYLVELKAQREELAEWLKEQQAKMLTERLQLVAQQQAYAVQKHQKHVIEEQVERRMSTLCLELRDIYDITRFSTGGFSICGITLPNIEAILSEGRQYGQRVSSPNLTPLALSAGLGYVAHLVQMIAIIMNRPLRNPIIYEPSHTRIMDIIKDLPSTSKEFPLFARGTMPSKQLQYGIYLLKQNIAQLCYDLTGPRTDSGITMENILHIFKVLDEIKRNQRNSIDVTQTHHDSIEGAAAIVVEETNNTATNTDGTERSNNVNENGIINNENLSTSQSSIDIDHVPIPPPALLPSLAIAATNHVSNFLKLLPANNQTLGIDAYATTTQRNCRSVGSYSDCEDDLNNMLEHTYSNSDSNITLQIEHR